ncbi:hypothetical protein D3C87_1639800 [compost metagenome]
MVARLAVARIARFATAEAAITTFVLALASGFAGTDPFALFIPALDRCGGSRTVEVPGRAALAVGIELAG